MKAVLVIDMPNRCDECLLCNDYGNYIECKKAERQLLTYDKPDWCPLKHPLKYISNDFYIYDTKYLIWNLDREIELLKGVKEFESNISD